MKKNQIPYKTVDKNFYAAQASSVNPLRKWFHLNRYRIANSLVKNKYENGKAIIDLGCGSCDWNLNNLPVFGLDLNKELLKAGKEKKRLYGYIVSNALNSGLPDASFDIVTMFEFLEHVKDYKKIVKESWRLLKKGGYCIISVPYDTFFSLWRPLFFLQVFFQGYILQKSYYKKKCGHINHFSPEKIKKIFLDQGYEIDFIFNMRRFTVFLCAWKKSEIIKPAKSRSYNDLSVIIPTLNEERNISQLLGYIIGHYKGCNIIVSDDGSRDNTRNNVLDSGYKKLIFLDRARYRIHGLTASVLDATVLVKTKYFIVMDGDGQHPPERIRDITNILRLGSKLVVSSRVEVEKWSFNRKIITYIGTLLGKTVLLLRNKNYISYDILGGFFGCNTEFWKNSYPYRFRKTRFRLKGFKILFDFLKYLPQEASIEETYYKFRTRKARVSKINLKIYSEFLKSCFLP